MLRCFLVLTLIGLVAGCAKKADLPEITVRAPDSGEFKRFRAELGTEFATARLQDFDTATQELQLDAMNRDVVTAEARERDMLAMINGKSVRAATLLGWEARHARFLREIAQIEGMLESDLKLQQNAGAKGVSSNIIARMASARNLIVQLQNNAATAESHLAELRATGNLPE